MSDQPSTGGTAAAPPPAAAAEAVQPLAPPASTSSVLTLEPPTAVQAVHDTAAPKMAPQVPAAALPDQVGIGIAKVRKLAPSCSIQELAATVTMLAASLPRPSSRTAA